MRVDVDLQFIYWFKNILDSHMLHMINPSLHHVDFVNFSAITPLTHAVPWNLILICSNINTIIHTNMFDPSTVEPICAL